MKKKIAVIDLGTNTCNLLIAEYDYSNFNILHQGKEVVKLGKNGIDKNQLTEDGLERAVLAIQKHQERIRNTGVSETVILATSAIREAINREWFQQEIKEKTGLEITVISGEKEAELIFKGVKLALGQLENHSLILDIGGGSNEFILTEAGESCWKQSFPLGMARIIEQIPPSDPITREEISQITDYFESQLHPLWKQLRNTAVSMLTGCSGAFDTLADLIDLTDAGTKTRISQEIRIDDFNRIYKSLVTSTTAERIRLKGMEPIRVEMIIPSVLLIKLVIGKLNIQKIVQTDFALREGVLYDRIFNSTGTV